MQTIKTEEFLKLAKRHTVLDVRSPGEYVHAHIPGAYNLPLFSDEERKVVGTAYKQEGREQAIKLGLDYFGVKMRKLVEEVERIIDSTKSKRTDSDNRTVLVHCWRGGMRSAGVSWLLGLYGFRVYTLEGGYKAFRNWALSQFELAYSFNIIGGYTGSGKTDALKELQRNRHIIMDLEGIAHHKGSAFGALGEEKQPTQEMFENLLAVCLSDAENKLPADGSIWLEDESRRIGNVNLPDALWKTMRAAPVYFLDVPVEERLEYITREYGKFKKEELVNSVLRIQKRLGGQNTKNAINYLLEDNIRECFRILLAYYDKYYAQSLQEHTGPLINIKCTQVDAMINSGMLADKKQLSDGITGTGN